MATGLRWTLVEDDPKAQLFPDEDLVERHVGTAELAGLELLHVRAKRMLNEVKVSPMPFRWTINAYRGCSHACGYCFARPTHEHLGLDAGVDFDTKIVVKVNAVERVRAELARPRWGGEHVAMGTNTDPYQRAEGKYHLYRGILGALVERENPFSILTKSTLVLRDLDLLRVAAEVTDVRVNLSIGCLDEDVWKAFEPGTPHPRQRMAAVRRLTEAGIPCGVLMGPVIPGVSDGDDQLRAVVEAAHDAGAVAVSAVALHLRPGVKPVFYERLAGTHPHLLGAFEARYGDRATLPKQEQRLLSERIRRFSAAARATRRGTGPVARHPAAMRGLRGTEVIAREAIGTRAIDTADGDLARIAAAQGLGPAHRPPGPPTAAAAPDEEQMTLF